MPDELDIDYDDDIEIVAYDPAWPDHYDREQSRLRAALDPVDVRRIEHIGSTAVPGLAAKPIVDVLVVVDNRDAAWNCVDRLEDIGYEFFAERTEREWWLQLGYWPADGQPFNCSVRPVETEGWRRNVLLREYLRDHPDARDEYERVKREAVAEYAADPTEYTKAKSPVIESILERARAAGYEEMI